MIDLRTVGDLRTAQRITDEEVEAAVDAFMADPLPPMFVFRHGYRLNLLKAVRNHPGARVFMERSDVGPALKRPFVRAAILLARPKG
ncbi:hypothetical protein [uncultured Methylobacterium sp.]|uniref:hypothetical protein n=1 Tax=uncultured Methylobacterium sp. TaxID=157278 RepID=UPI0035CB81B2